MSYATEHIANTLKAARKSKGLSQRELSAKSGVPQGHISKIENGTVDLRISSLVALGRALDLELTLVPRKTIPAVRSVVRSSAHGTLLHVEGIRQFRKEMERLEKTIDDLPRDGQSKTELAHFQRQVQRYLHEIKNFKLTPPEIEPIRAAIKAIKTFKNLTIDGERERQTLTQLQNMRNELAHGAANAPRIEAVRSAYSLDEDDYG